jgi:hypothetical protein
MHLVFSEFCLLKAIVSICIRQFCAYVVERHLPFGFSVIRILSHIGYICSGTKKIRIFYDATILWKCSRPVVEQPRDTV